MKTTATTPAASIGGSNKVPAMKKEMVATYALLLAVRTSDSCAIDAATARPMARPMWLARPRPWARPRYAANTASAATATMYVAAHGESSVNWLRAADPRPLTRLKSLIVVVPVSVSLPCQACLGHPAPQHSPLLHTTSLQVASLHVTSLQVTSLHVTSLHVTSLHVTSLHVTSLHVAAVLTALATSLQTTSLHVMSLHVTSLHVTSLHVTLP